MWYALACTLILLGLVGVVVPVLPGGPLMFAGIVALAWADGFARIGWPTLVVAGLLMLAMWGIDIAAGLLGARKYGASWWGTGGALVGLLAGIPFGIVGIIVGPIVGAVALEWVKHRDIKRATQAGKGTLIGFVFGAFLKLLLAFAMLGVALAGWMM